MNSKRLYSQNTGVYDLLDKIYFRNYESSPRKAVLDAIHDGDKVLDLCTGTATSAINIAKAMPSVEVVGVDLSKEMLHAAESKAREAGVTHLKLHCMDAANLGFADGSFDKVLLSLVLHETAPNKAAAMLTEARRVLKEDGALIVTEWERSKSLGRKIVYLVIELLEPEPYKTFVAQDMEQYFRGHGFEITEYRHCDYSRVMIMKKLL